MKITKTADYVALKTGVSKDEALRFAEWFYNERGRYVRVWVDYAEAFYYWKEGGR